MKNYKKAALATMVLAAMPLLAATSNTAIKVTTFADENGENNNACSLREALKTAADRRSYGGCTVVDITSVSTKVIQLEAGTYSLDKELAPEVNVSILGKTPADWTRKSIIINDYPAQTNLETIITAKNATRLFNTTIGNRFLGLTHIILKDGNTSDRGGAIYAGADVNLLNTQILNSQAAKEGGAIFMAGPFASLTINHSLIQGNQAPKASVIAMSCFNDNVYSKRDIDITTSSLIGNGSNASSSMLEFCGEPDVNLSTNTIAKNIASSTNGSIIKFTGDTKAGTETNNTSSILSDASLLTLNSNTIVENTANTTLLYDKMGLKALSFNLLAYNIGTNACRYLLGPAADEKAVGVGLVYNALALVGANKCDVPTASLPTDHTNIDVSGINDVRTLLSPLQTASEATAFLPIYYPKNNNTNNDLVNVGLSGAECSANDQRGIFRNTTNTLYFDPTANNTCDIGAVELMKLAAADKADISNKSLKLELTDPYKMQFDRFDALVKNPDDPNLIASDKEQLALYKNLVENTKTNLHYRAIYINLKKNVIPASQAVSLLPQEIEQDGEHRLKFYSKDSYTVTAEPLGRGQINDSVTNIDTGDKENLVCEWNADLEQIIFYRKDDVITQAGDKVFCKYTIQLNSDPTIKSSGLIQAAFVNIAPEAKNTSLTFKYQKHEKKVLNLLDFANDEGDTGEGGAGPVNKPNKPKFWKNADGVELPIRLIDVPETNLVITADRQGACPEPDQEETCYGGNIYVQEKNTFNPFNFNFKYKVYDADGLASNEATVNTISTATTTDDTRNASGGSGGGSINMFGLFGLFGLLAYRRFKK